MLIFVVVRGVASAAVMGRLLSILVLVGGRVFGALACGRAAEPDAGLRCCDCYCF